MCEMLLKVNNFAADIGKSLWSFHKCINGRFIRLCQISHDLFSNDFLDNTLIQLFFISHLVWDANLMLFNKKKI